MSWFKKPENIAVAVGATALAVVVIVLLVWGITHHHEEGLLKACWDQGIARYEKGSAEEVGPDTEEFCAEPEDLIWLQKQIPISIIANQPGGTRLDTKSDEYRVLSHAVRDLNGQFRFNILNFAIPNETIDAEVRIGTPIEVLKNRNPPGHVIHAKIDDTIHGIVSIRSDVAADDRLLYLVAQHELLHLIGLKHDDFESSLMFPITREDWNAKSLSSAHVTDHDVELIQKLYKR